MLFSDPQRRCHLPALRAAIAGAAFNAVSVCNALFFELE
jgi:hypothetical protein